MMFKCSLDTVSRLGRGNQRIRNNIQKVTERREKAQRKIHGTFVILAFCHPMMVSEARAKNVPGLVPKQMEILGREKRLENFIYKRINLTSSRLLHI